MQIVNLAEIEQAVKARLSDRRFAHSLGVANSASQMAAVYGANQTDAQLAGVLHDWDRDLSAQQLIDKAAKYQASLPEQLGVINAQFSYDPIVLHAHTAARSLAEEYPGIGHEVIQAIDRHTSAAANMTDLDMIIYVADLIEPTRNYGQVELTSMQEKLRAMVGSEKLEILFIMHLQMTLSHLLESKTKIVPLSLEAMDDMLMRVNDPKHPVWQLAKQTRDACIQASNMEDQ